MNGSIHYCRNNSATSLLTCQICSVEDSAKKFVSYDLYRSTITLCSHCLKKIYSMDVVGKDTNRGDIEGIAVAVQNTKYENCILTSCKHCSL
ncbi:Hypothetical protein PACV_176 [Pacmanvirus A23]|uniref:Hypothetical protein n=1 Tax=Pacmanvirus A23 TaxID=1932881 RepID=UPI000A092452|nr:Hypothetical protein B9W72_gp174 [Pacmanvirus A23]SIP85891.1 Hypothetical protein PACV_176 [Pacmanvirus A23]